METNSEIVHSFLEFLLIEGLVVVIIGNLELLTNTRNTSGTSSGDLLLDVLQDLSLSGILGDTTLLLLGLWLWSSEDVVILLGSWLGIVHGPSLGSHSLSRLLGELPGIVHHGHEVHVVIDG